MLVSIDEMYAAKVPPEEMGFCAHKLIQYRACIEANRPWFTNCGHEKHEFLHCKHEE